VVGGSIVIFPDSAIMVFPLPFSIPGWIFGALFIIYSIVGAREQWDNVGHAAHLGGTLFGIGLMVSFYPSLAIDHWIYIVALVASVGGAWAFLALRRARRSS
jgi:membrane associated rhomboid family serine protease